MRDYTYIDDIVDGVVFAIDRPFDCEIINLGAGKTTNLRDTIKLISKALGKMAVIDEQPLQTGDALVTQADISKARRLLGYEPNFDLEEGVRRFAEWYFSGKSGARGLQASSG